ncbi:MAG TPA: helix-turn-helix domain-containing protein [Chloroflexia bacterium]|nr:helix-turn-helix domain-containing protein [Chloroflexia bacterium]
MEFVFDARLPASSYVEMIWHTRSEGAGTFTSTASSNWEMVVTISNGKPRMAVRGPETRASPADFPSEAEFFGITFKPGTFMPHLPLRNLLDRQDSTLPAASDRSFWLHGSAWELPTFENAEVFVQRLIRQEIVVQDPLVAAALQGQRPALSPRSLQYRFLEVTGLTYKTIQQIERAHRAAVLLEQGRPIVDTAIELGYFDQAHLTNSLKRFLGKTPALIVPNRLAA